MYSKEETEMLSNLLESAKEAEQQIMKEAESWRDPVMTGYKPRQCELLQRILEKEIGGG